MFKNWAAFVLREGNSFMIMNSTIAVNNVLKYNNELSAWVNKICDEIEKKASVGKYSYYAAIDSRHHNMTKDVAAFFQDELGYRVYLINSNIIDIYWQDYNIEDVKRDDYLTASAACRIADDISKSYDNVCKTINRYIETCSKNGENHCIYVIGNLCSSVVEEIKEDLLDAGYDVELNDNKFIIKWGQ